MKEADRDQILRAYDEAARSMQFDSFSAFIRYVCQKSQEHINQVRHARTRKGLEAWLTKEPNMGADQLNATVKAIRLIPYTLRKVLPGAAKEAAQKFPHDPGGHPKSIKDEEWPKVWDEITERIRKGMDSRAAQKEIAKSRKVSLRTIQRGWKRRGIAEGQDQQIR